MDCTVVYKICIVCIVYRNKKNKKNKKNKNPSFTLLSPTKDTLISPIWQYPIITHWNQEKVEIKDKKPRKTSFPPIKAQNTW